MTDYSSLVDTGRWAHPHLANEPMDQADAFLGACGENAELIYARLARACPDAGARYWAVRTWSLMIWQLIYLSTGCAIRKKMTFCPSIIVQHIKGASVYGYHLNAAESNVNQLASAQMALKHSSPALQTMLERLYQKSRRVFLLGEKNAFRLVAAIGCEAIVQCFGKICQSNEAPCASGKLEAYQVLSQTWLESMNLVGEASLIGHQQGAEVVRRACCMHYRVSASDKCANCPLHRSERRTTQP